MGNGRRDHKRNINYTRGQNPSPFIGSTCIISYMETILSFITDNIQMFYLIILMIFVGIELIGHVPSVLHTPLMSGANAIHGVVIIGSIIVMGQAHETLSLILGFIAVVMG